ADAIETVFQFLVDDAARMGGTVGDDHVLRLTEATARRQLDPVVELEAVRRPLDPHDTVCLEQIARTHVEVVDDALVLDVGLHPADDHRLPFGLLDHCGTVGASCGCGDASRRSAASFTNCCTIALRTSASITPLCWAASPTPFG